MILYQNCTEPGEEFHHERTDKTITNHQYNQRRFHNITGTIGIYCQCV